MRRALSLSDPAFLRARQAAAYPTPTAYWPFDSFPGSSFPDVIGGFNAAGTGDVLLDGSGQVGGCAFGNRSAGAYTLVAPSGAYPAGASSTIAGWFNLASNPGGIADIFQKGLFGADWTLQVVGTDIQFYYGGNPFFSLGTNTLSTWYHFAIVFVNGGSPNTFGYLNGSLVASTSAGGGPQNSQALNMMYDPVFTDRTSNMRVDEWAVWAGTALLAGQVLAVYNQGAANLPLI